MHFIDKFPFQILCLASSSGTVTTKVTLMFLYDSLLFWFKIASRPQMGLFLCSSVSPFGKISPKLGRGFFFMKYCL